MTRDKKPETHDAYVPRLSRSWRSPKNLIAQSFQSQQSYTALDLKTDSQVEELKSLI